MEIYVAIVIVIAIIIEISMSLRVSGQGKIRAIWFRGEMVGRSWLLSSQMKNTTTQLLPQGSSRTVNVCLYIEHAQSTFRVTS
jgi:hypothetical protein